MSADSVAPSDPVADRDRRELLIGFDRAIHVLDCTAEAMLTGGYCSEKRYYGAVDLAIEKLREVRGKVGNLLGEKPDDD